MQKQSERPVKAETINVLEEYKHSQTLEENMRAWIGRVFPGQNPSMVFDNCSNCVMATINVFRGKPLQPVEAVAKDMLWNQTTYDKDGRVDGREMISEDETMRRFIEQYATHIFRPSGDSEDPIAIECKSEVEITKVSIRLKESTKKNLIEDIVRNTPRNNHVENNPYCPAGSGFGFVTLASRVNGKPAGHIVNYYVTPENTVWFIDAQTGEMFKEIPVNFFKTVFWREVTPPNGFIPRLESIIKAVKQEVLPSVSLSSSLGAETVTPSKKTRGRRKKETKEVLPNLPLSGLLGEETATPKTKTPKMKNKRKAETEEVEREEAETSKTNGNKKAKKRQPKEDKKATPYEDFRKLAQQTTENLESLQGMLTGTGLQQSVEWATSIYQECPALAFFMQNYVKNVGAEAEEKQGPGHNPLPPVPSSSSSSSSSSSQGTFSSLALNKFAEAVKQGNLSVMETLLSIVPYENRWNYINAALPNFPRDDGFNLGDKLAPVLHTIIKEVNPTATSVFQLLQLQKNTHPNRGISLFNVAALHCTDETLPEVCAILARVPLQERIQLLRSSISSQDGNIPFSIPLLGYFLYKKEPAKLVALLQTLNDCTETQRLSVIATPMTEAPLNGLSLVALAATMGDADALDAFLRPLSVAARRNLVSSLVDTGNGHDMSLFTVALDVRLSNILFSRNVDFGYLLEPAGQRERAIKTILNFLPTADVEALVNGIPSTSEWFVSLNQYKNQRRAASGLTSSSSSSVSTSHQAPHPPGTTLLRGQAPAVRRQLWPQFWDSGSTPPVADDRAEESDEELASGASGLPVLGGGKLPLGSA